MTTTLERRGKTAANGKSVGGPPATGPDIDAASYALKTRGADEYPLLMRMGHSFEAVVGQRLLVDGFYGALDVAIGGDGWYYVLNKMVTGELYPRVRIAVCNINDEFPRNIVPMIDGKPDTPLNEMFKSPVCCDSDGKGTFFFTDEHANKVVMISTKGETLGWWGEAGTKPGQFNAPAGIIYSPKDGTLWVVNSKDSRVQQFTTDGKFIRGFGKAGAGPGELNYPWGIAVDPVNGTVLVADWRNDRIQRFSPDGEPLQVIDTPGRGRGPLKRPSGVAVDAHGDIYVVDRGNDRVLQFNPRGMFIESFLGDAYMTERGADKLMANPNMCRWRDHMLDLDREKRFWKPSMVKVDSEFRVHVVDAGRFRLQIYRKRFRVLQPGQADGAETFTAPFLN